MSAAASESSNPQRSDRSDVRTTHKAEMVGATRFEPATSSTPWKRATKLRHAPTRSIGYPGGGFTDCRLAAHIALGSSACENRPQPPLNAARVHSQPMSSLDLELVRHALAVARQRGYVEVELGADGFEFTAHLEPAPKLHIPVPTAEAAADDGMVPIKAALVGYYTAAKAPLKKGQKVKSGDVIAGITALGIANDIESTATGEVKEVLVKNGDPVEYGQTIAVVKVAK